MSYEYCFHTTILALLQDLSTRRLNCDCFGCLLVSFSLFYISFYHVFSSICFGKIGSDEGFDGAAGCASRETMITRSCSALTIFHRVLNASQTKLEHS